MALRSLLTPLFCLTLTSAGCALRGDNRGVAYTIDAASITVGAAAMAKGDPEACDRDPLDDCVFEHSLLQDAGTVLLVAGLLGVLVNYAVNIGVEPEPAVESTPLTRSGTAAATAPSFCNRLIDDWRGETDLARKTARYEAMPGSCQGQLDRRADRGTPRFCDRLVRAWKAENDFDRKAKRYQAMPDSCRAELRPQP